MKLFLGSDHGGYYLKEKLEAYLAKRGYDVEDVGDTELDPDDDFPQFAAQAAVRVLGEEEKDDPRAILICTGGQGMAIAANRFKGIRAVVVSTPQEAKESRDDNDANILCLPARLLDAPDDDLELWKDVVDTWLSTPFAGAARYKRRNHQLDELN
jgi:ribose 5-phosphate isomerase B